MKRASTIPPAVTASGSPSNLKMSSEADLVSGTTVSVASSPLLDAKGFKTQMYRLKKRMAAVLLRITIEEV